MNLEKVINNWEDEMCFNLKYDISPIDDDCKKHLALALRTALLEEVGKMKVNHKTWNGDKEYLYTNGVDAYHQALTDVIEKIKEE